MKKVIIIGAGLLGCFSARALSEYDLDITVLESSGDVCTGISKAGTGIVYAGYDNKPGTLKSRLCISAGKNFAERCRMLGVKYRKCGSLMLSFGPVADERLLNKLENGRIGGIAGLRVISREEALELEPCIAPSVSTALYSEETGTVNPWELCIAAYECAVGNGVTFRFGQKVTGIARNGNKTLGEQRGFVVETERSTYYADAVLNCAGLNSAAIRELCEKPSVRLLPSAADYIVTDKETGKYISHIIFHEPEEKSKGLTIVPTVNGNLLIGPTERSIPQFAEMPDGVLGLFDFDSYDNRTAEEGIASLRNMCSEVVPGLPLDRIIRTYGCIRPNPYYVTENHGRMIREKKSISELKLIEENGLYSFIGVKTPGMTFSAELGAFVTGRVVEYLGDIRRRSDYDPCRTPIADPALMEKDERAVFVSENPDYGRIICRCEEISEGQIREAISRGANTVEAVKRRTSACMGRCQGSYCRQQIIQILEEMQAGEQQETKQRQ